MEAKKRYCPVNFESYMSFSKCAQPCLVKTYNHPPPYTLQSRLKACMLPLSSLLLYCLRKFNILKFEDSGSGLLKNHTCKYVHSISVGVLWTLSGHDNQQVLSDDKYYIFNRNTYTDLFRNND